MTADDDVAAEFTETIWQAMADESAPLSMRETPRGPDTEPGVVFLVRGVPVLVVERAEFLDGIHAIAIDMMESLDRAGLPLTAALLSPRPRPVQ